MSPVRDELRFAVGTYTRVPVTPPIRVDPAVAGRGLALGPLVGAVLGLVSGLPLLLPGDEPVARLLAGTLTVALAAWLTRALHWDGLADLADGLGSGATRERATEIMRRSDLGPFGALTLVLVVAVQVLCLGLLPAGSAALAGWLLAVALGRLAVAVACGPWAHPARPDGLGALAVGSVTAPRLLVAAGITALVALAGVLGGFLTWAPLLVAAAASASTALVITRIAARRLGGSSGDVLGAVAELSTAAALLALALFA